jgi:hypothetical protein
VSRQRWGCFTGGVSFIGAGGEDWVELDLDLFDRLRLSRLRSLLDDEAPRLVRVLGADYEIEIDDDGRTFLVVGGHRRYRAEVSRTDRLVLTGLLDPDGPL